MWTRDKIGEFSENYLSFKNYELWFQVDVRAASKSHGIHRASFENKAIDVAEFDMAINQLNKTEKFCFLTSLLGLEKRDIAWFAHLDSEVVDEVLFRASQKVEFYLIQLYKRPLVSVGGKMGGENERGLSSMG